MKKQVLALSLLLSLGVTGNAFAKGPDTLRIGTDPTYSPFSMKDAQGKLTGFDVDLATEICKRMESKCTFVESDFDGLIPSLKAKKVDAIIASISITEKRQQEIDFSEKLYAADSRLIAPKGSKIQPTLESLKGKTIGLLQGTTQETFANEYWRPKGVTVVPYANQDLVYQDLTAGRIDAAFQDEFAASEGFLKQPVGKDYAFAGPAVKDDKLFGVGTGIGMRKGSTELKAAIDTAFESMRADGTYDKLAKKYFDFNVYGD